MFPQAHIGFVPQNNKEFNQAFVNLLCNYPTYKLVLLSEHGEPKLPAEAEEFLVGQKNREQFELHCGLDSPELLADNLLNCIVSCRDTPLEVRLSIVGSLSWQAATAYYVASLAKIEELLDYNTQTKDFVFLPILQNSYDLGPEEKEILRGIHNKTLTPNKNKKEYARFDYYAKKLVKRGLVIKDGRHIPIRLSLTPIGSLIAPHIDKLRN